MFCCLKTPTSLLSSALYLLLASSIPLSLALPSPDSHDLVAVEDRQLQLTPRQAHARSHQRRAAGAVTDATPEQAQLPPSSEPEQPFSAPQALPPGEHTTCAYTKYKPAEVSLAIQAACYFFRNGLQAGMSPYPHIYYNYAGLNFNGVRGPYQEFPLQKGMPYNGGNPGADRIIINGNCEYAGAVTHSGARVHKGIVPCSNTT